MAFRSLTALPANAVRLAAGHNVLLSPALQSEGTCLEVIEGVARVYCPCEETEGMTIAFLQPGDQMRTDRLCSDGVCVEALTPLLFCSGAQASSSEEGFDSINEWTLQLLRLRHIGRAEDRLQGLLGLLVTRLGKRSGRWCVLPFRLSHERIGELIGVTRVTTTKLISRLRSERLVVVPDYESVLCVEPDFIASTPFAA
jgi:CRP-like cAMP-binding protein